MISLTDEGISIRHADGRKPRELRIGSAAWPREDECIGWGEAILECVTNQQDLPPEFAALVSENFDELLER